MSSPALIDSLTRDLKPVRAVPSARVMAFFWAMGAVGLVAAVVLGTFGARPNLPSAMAGPGLWAMVISCLGVIVSSSYVGFRLSLPGQPLTPMGARLPLISLVIFLGVLALHWVPAGARFSEGFAAAGMKCTGVLLVLTIIPALVFFAVARRLASMNPGQTARLIGISAGAVGAFGLALHCPSGHCVHLVAYHGLPVLFCGALLRWFGTRFLRW